MPDQPAQPDPKEIVEARLCAYLEGELPAAEAADLERHLAEHPVHQRLLSDLSAQRAWLRALPQERAPAEVADAYQQQAERSMLMGEDRPPIRLARRWPQIAMIAAMVLVTVGLAAMLALMLSGPSNRPPGEQVAMAPPTVPTSPASRPALLGPVGAGAKPSLPAAIGGDGLAMNNRLANVDAEGGLAQNRRGAAEANTQLGQAAPIEAQSQTSAPAAAEPVARTVYLTVTTADPDAIDAAVRQALGGAVQPKDAAMAKMAEGRSAGRPRAVSGGRAGGMAYAATPVSRLPVDRQYVAAGLTPDQAVRLTTDLKAAAGPGGNVTPATRPALLARGQTVTVVIPQLTGTPGLTAANVVQVSPTDGTVRLPMVDPVPAAGESAAALAAQVASAYRRAELIPHPTVTVVPGTALDLTPRLPATQPLVEGSTTVVIDVRPLPSRR